MMVISLPIDHRPMEAWLYCWRISSCSCCRTLALNPVASGSPAHVNPVAPIEQTVLLLTNATSAQTTNPSLSAC